jgi:hypothetical protein
MCTVTVVPIERQGFRLMCNRDERLERPPASSPQVFVTGSRTAIYPIDPAGGGTWVGVNDMGFAAALLNRHRPDGADFRDRAAISRGAVVPMLLADCDGINAAVRAMRNITLSQFAPFTMIAVSRRQAVVFANNGRELLLESTLVTRPMLLTSSSLGDKYVEAPRRRLFEQLLGIDPTEWLDGQARFHQHRWPHRADISVWMERSDAATVSCSIVDVSPHGVRFRYRDVRSRPPTLRAA